MGCGASVQPSNGDNLQLLNNPKGIIAKDSEGSISNSAKLEEFVMSSSQNSSHIEAVRRFFLNQSALDAFIEFLKTENSEENANFLTVKTYYNIYSGL